MDSDNFQKFYESCFSNSFAHQYDGVDEEALLRLQGLELLRAATLIMRALPKTEDRRPIRAAGLLRLQAASDILRRRLETIDADYSWCRVENAWALYQIERAPEAAPILLDMLHHASHDSLAWLSAVCSLRDFEPTSQIISSLLWLLTHAEKTFSFIELLQHQFGVPRVTELWRLPPPEWAQMAEEAVQGWLEPEMAATEDSLLNRLEETGDFDLVVALGLIRSHRAAEVLHQMLDRQGAKAVVGEKRVAVALALYRIEGFPQAADVLIEILRSDLVGWQRRAALDALMVMKPTPQVTYGLLEEIERIEPDEAKSFFQPDLSDSSIRVLEHLFHEGAQVRDLLSQARGGFDPFKQIPWQPPSPELMRQLRQAIDEAQS